MYKTDEEVGDLVGTERWFGLEARTEAASRYLSRDSQSTTTRKTYS